MSDPIKVPPTVEKRELSDDKIIPNMTSKKIRLEWTSDRLGTVGGSVGDVQAPSAPQALLQGGGCLGSELIQAELPGSAVGLEAGAGDGSLHKGGGRQDQGETWGSPGSGLFQTALSGLEGGAGGGALLPAGGRQNQGGTVGDPGSGFFQTALPGPVGGLKSGAGDGPGLYHPALPGPAGVLEEGAKGGPGLPLPAGSLEVPIGRWSRSVPSSNS